MPKFTMSQLSRMKVYVPTKPKKGQAPEEALKKMGRVHNLVFAPDSRTVVGFMIKRPDIAGMIKQEDRFVAIDAIAVNDKAITCSSAQDAFDQAACKSRNIDFDSCIIWEGCDVKTQAGQFLGYVVDACFDLSTGVVDYFAAQEGSTASALVGNFEIPAAWVLSYKGGTMVVRSEAANLELSGGLAGKAGEGYAVAKDKAKEGVAKADEAAAKAVDKGSHALGGVIGRTKQTFAETASGFKEGMGTSDKAVSTASGTKVEKQANNADNVQKAAQAVGNQLNKSKGMFSDFMREFKEASK